MKKKRQQPDMELLRQTVGFLNATQGHDLEHNRAQNLAAFMAFFHPERKLMSMNEAKAMIRKE